MIFLIPDCRGNLLWYEMYLKETSDCLSNEEELRAFVSDPDEDIISAIVVTLKKSRQKTRPQSGIKKGRPAHAVHGATLSREGRGFRVRRAGHPHKTSSLCPLRE